MIVPFPPQAPPAVGLVQFNNPEFINLFPDFAGLVDTQNENAFNQAQALVENDQGSLVQDANKRQQLLYLVTAHLAFLFYGTAPANGKSTAAPAPNSVGRITEARQASISIKKTLGSVNASFSQDFFLQSKYGALYWQMSIPYRQGRVVTAKAGPENAGLVPPMYLGYISYYGFGTPDANW